MKFIFGLFIVVILIFVLFGSILGKVIRFFASSENSNSNRQRNNNRSNTSSAPDTPKKFSKEEGEYVSYEEVKDEDVK